MGIPNSRKVRRHEGLAGKSQGGVRRHRRQWIENRKGFRTSLPALKIGSKVGYLLDSEVNRHRETRSVNIAAGGVPQAQRKLLYEKEVGANKQVVV